MVDDVMLTTRQVARFVGKQLGSVRYLSQRDPAFPAAVPIRNGTMLTFSFAQVQDWMQKHQITPQCSLEEALKVRGNVVGKTLTTKQVLLLLGRSSRDWLAALVKSGDFPEPCLRQRGKQGQNLWLEQEVENFLAKVEAQTHVGSGYYSRSEVMQILDRQAWTLVQWIRQGRFPSPDIESRTGKPQPHRTRNRWKGLTTQYWKQQTLQHWLTIERADYPQGFDPSDVRRRFAALRQTRKA